MFFWVKYFFKRLHLPGVAFIDNSSVLQNEKAWSECDVVALRVNLGYNHTRSVLSRQEELRVLIALIIAIA